MDHVNVILHIIAESRIKSTLLHGKLRYVLRLAL
jgi:hypothetical protein